MGDWRYDLRFVIPWRVFVVNVWQLFIMVWLPEFLFSGCIIYYIFVISYFLFCFCLRWLFLVWAVYWDIFLNQCLCIICRPAISASWGYGLVFVLCAKTCIVVIIIECSVLRCIRQPEACKCIYKGNRCCYCICSQWSSWEKRVGCADGRGVE